MVDRFPGYWDAASIKLDRIVYQPAGQRDIAERLGPTDAGAVMKEPKLGLIAQPALAYETMGFNMANTSPLQNPLVRDAFEVAIDRGVIKQSRDGRAVHPVQPVRGAGQPSMPTLSSGVRFSPTRRAFWVCTNPEQGYHW